MLSVISAVCSSMKGIDKETAISFVSDNHFELLDIFPVTNKIRLNRRGKKIDLCSIVNAKSGGCPEDCFFCAQSVHNETQIDEYSLLGKRQVLDAASSSRHFGVRRFCLVTSGRKVAGSDLHALCNYIFEIRQMGLLPCATLGLLDRADLIALMEAGLHRYHHNLETSEAFFSEICSTHTYRDKIRTIEAAKSLGLSVCSGGIFGMGESWEDRIEMAFALKNIGVDCVPINFFTPIKGTPMGSASQMDPFEALKVIALFRLILPGSEIRVCGGRPNTLRDLHPMIFMAGADSLLIGNYLTTSGRDPEADLQMIRDMGLEI